MTEQRDKDRRARGDAHWRAVDWSEKLLGLLVMVAGISLYVWAQTRGDQIGMALGGAIAGSGLYAAAPPARPFLSRLVNLIPGLPNRGRPPFRDPSRKPPQELS